MAGDGVLELSVQLISGILTVGVLRLYIFPSGCSNFFLTSLSWGVCSSQWCGSQQAFASSALHPSKMKSLLLQLYSSIQQWPSFIQFLVFLDLPFHITHLLIFRLLGSSIQFVLSHSSTEITLSVLSCYGDDCLCLKKAWRSVCATFPIPLKNIWKNSEQLLISFVFFHTLQNAIITITRLID